MLKRTLISATIVALYSLAGTSWAAEGEQVQQQVQKKEHEKQVAQFTAVCLILAALHSALLDEKLFLSC